MSKRLILAVIAAILAVDNVSCVLNSLILEVIAAILAVARVISESFDPLIPPFKALSILEGVTLKASAD